MSKHTPGLLAVQSQGPGGPTFLLGPEPESKFLARMGLAGPWDGAWVTNCDEDEANAVHLAACWNACDGINPEAVPLVVKPLEQIIAWATGVVDSTQSKPGEYGGIPIAIALEAIAALAKAKEQEQP